LLSLETHLLLRVTILVVILVVGTSGAFADEGRIQLGLLSSPKDILIEERGGQTVAILASATEMISGADSSALEGEMDNEISDIPSTWDNYLVKPAAISQVSLRPQGEPFIYEVVGGDTLSGIAQRFGISVNTIKWANNLADVNSIKPGQKLTILPVSGVLYRVGEGDSLEKIVEKFHGSVERVISYNGLEGQNLTAGQLLIIPGGWIDEPRPQPQPQPNQAPSPRSVARQNQNSSNRSSVSSSGTRVSYGNSAGKFPGGWCTTWVAMHRYIPWRGNAGTWLSQARRYGYATGSEPRVGAIVVTSESWWGHVALVEAVHDGYITISEMNYVGRGIVSRRTIPAHGGVVRGYIY